MMTGILQWKRKERKLLGRQDEEDWRLVVCLGRGGTEGGAKNEAQAFGLVTMWLVVLVTKMRNSGEEQDWGG